MKVTLECPHAEYRDDMRIYCTKAQHWCGNVYFKRCKGWWVQNDAARQCPLRRTAEDSRVKTRQIR